MRSKALWFVLALALVSQSAAAEEKASRAATKKDLVGTWELVSVRPVHDPKDPVFFPYQRFVFNADSSMKFMASADPFTQEWMGKFNKQPASIDYAVSEKGVLTMTWQETVHSESALAAFVLQDVPPDLKEKLTDAQKKGLPKKNDVTLSFLNSRGKIAYQKVLTKIA
jgi:hypothetical protein